MKKVITYGTFDLFHQGHLNLLTRAKKLGDYLIVGVTTEHFDEARGKVNVIDSTLERIENVRKTGLADEIIIEDHEGQKIEDIQKYHIDIFTVGSDWVGTFDYLNNFCQVVYLERTPDISSTILRKSRFRIINVGIVGTGRMAPRFLAEDKYVSGIHIVCAYNPETESGEEFRRRHEIPVYSADYEAFLENVDAVYIASPNETHYGYAKRALLAGRHVLSENPVALSKRDMEELYALADEKNLVLLEGIKTAYCPGFQQLLNTVQSGKIGEVRDVEACFTKLTDPAGRELTDPVYGGSLIELGTYVLLPMIGLFGEAVKQMRFHSIWDENGNDLFTKIDLDYETGFGLGKVGLGVKSEGELIVSGTKGYLYAKAPWWLTKEFELRYENPNEREHFTFEFESDGLQYELRAFVEEIQSKRRDDCERKRMSIAFASVMERFLQDARKRKVRETHG